LFIWIFQKALAQRLLIWAWISITLGVLCFLPGSDFWAGLAFQFFGWALVSLAIGGFGYFSVRQRQEKLTLEEKKSAAPEETSNMSLLLRGSSILSVICFLGGLALTFSRQTRDSFGIGAGVGIILQSAFVFFFSRYHLRKLQ
jgi:hypothetical protein